MKNIPSHDSSMCGRVELVFLLWTRPTELRVPLKNFTTCWTHKRAVPSVTHFIVERSMRSYDLVSPVLFGLLNRFHILHHEPMWKKFPFLQNYELSSSRRFDSNTIRLVLFVPCAFHSFHSHRMDGTNGNGTKSASNESGDTHPWSGTDSMELPIDSYSAVGRTE